MLVEHGINDVNERLIAVEQSVPAGQQIAFQPALALMLAEHLQHAARRARGTGRWDRRRFPLPIGRLKYCLQTIGERLIGTEHSGSSVARR